MNFDDFSDLLESRWRVLAMPLQICWKKYGEVYREDAGWIIDFVSRLAEHFGDAIEEVIAAYHERVREQTREQKEFDPASGYRFSREEELRGIIGAEGFRKSNLYTLALSYILSLHRYELLLFLRSCADDFIREGSSCLQVGTGIGLEAYLADRRRARIDTYDINPYSALCLRLLGVSSRVAFYPEVYRFNEPEKFDHCLAVELMEHLEKPGDFLADLTRVLKPGGDALLTFALRMPQVDHIYCFRTVSEVREMIGESGLRIEREEYFISSFLGFDESRKEELAESSPYAAVYAVVARKF